MELFIKGHTHAPAKVNSSDKKPRLWPFNLWRAIRFPAWLLGFLWGAVVSQAWREGRYKAVYAYLRYRRRLVDAGKVKEPYAN